MAQEKQSKPPSQVTLCCQNCGTEFDVPRAWERNGRRKFCSRTCQNEAQRQITGDRHPRTGKRHTAESRAKMSANLKGRTGPRASQWKGGTYLAHGYRYLLVSHLPEGDRKLAEPMVRSGGYVMEHRLVMARKLGRPLTSTEMVHHINGEKADNRPENLALADRAAHSREHRLVEKRLVIMEAENQRLKFLLMWCLLSGVITSS